MLRISVVDSAKKRRVILEGKLIAPWAAELRIAFERAKAGLGDRKLVIEMKQVTTIGQEGEDAILELMNAGARFHCDGVFTKHVLRHLTCRSNKNVRDPKS